MTMNLRAAVQQAMQSSSSTDPSSIARELLSQIEDEELRDALAQALPAFVMSQVTRSRAGVPAQNPGRSQKVAAIRAHWERFLAERVQVDGVWMTMAECTADDVTALAGYRRQVAEKNLAHARRFDQLAKTMRSEGAVTVAALDPSLAGDILAG